MKVDKLIKRRGKLGLVKVRIPNTVESKDVGLFM